MRRIYSKGHLHYITCSCYRREQRLGTARSRDVFLEIFEQVRRRYKFIVVGFVVLPEHMIDSSILIAAGRGALDLRKSLGEGGEEIALSAITASELLHGVHRATRIQRGRREAFVEQLLASIPVLPFDLLAARVHA